MGGLPFSAIVGQHEIKQALLIAAVDARVGGVMIFGDRGTGKSTAARDLATSHHASPVRSDADIDKLLNARGEIWSQCKLVRREMAA